MHHPIYAYSSAEDQIQHNRVHWANPI